MSTLKAKTRASAENSCTQAASVGTKTLADLRTEINKPVRGFSDAAMTSHSRHTSPGNVCELRNAVERALLYCRGLQIECNDLPGRIGKTATPSDAAAPIGPGGGGRLVGGAGEGRHPGCPDRLRRDSSPGGAAARDQGDRALHVEA